MTEINAAAESAMVRNLKTWLPDHRPILTVVGITALGIPSMHVEIEVSAQAPQ
jgi:enamine deaminase RidA (YjgF/YER057c/UK114 family)